MSSDGRLPVVLCWHMHQPEYRDLASRQVIRPWVLLRALKDYVDMAAHLEAAPLVRAVVNFSPVLLDQIEDCAVDLRERVRHGRTARNPLVQALVELPMRGTPARAELVMTCVRPMVRRIVERSRGYAEIAESARAAIAREDAGELDDEHVRTLLVRYLLCWCGESLRTDPRWLALEAQASALGPAQCAQLLGLVHDAIVGLLPRYAALARSGRIELSMSPYHHPVAPLLIDFASARDAVPDAPLPASNYPGGSERVRWHLQQGLARFEALLGVRPRGCWPAEAAVSDESLALIAQAGFSWTASSESVLAASLRASGCSPADPHGRYVLDARALSCFFRDDGLSDRIGFAYQAWEGAAAAADFVGLLERLPRGPGRCVSVILDGENPWDGYARNGADFIKAVYQGLSSHPSLRLATFSDCVGQTLGLQRPLPRLVAGSWGNGQLMTWIGHPEKNRMWHRLIEAKREFDRAPRDAPVEQLLGACEGSDWFWWPASASAPEVVADMDHLFTLHLDTLFRAMKPGSPDGGRADSSCRASPPGNR